MINLSSREFFISLWNLLTYREKKLGLTWLVLQTSMVLLDLSSIILVGIVVSAFVPIIQSKESGIPLIVQNLYSSFDSLFSLYEFLFLMMGIAGSLLLMRAYLVTKIDSFFFQRICSITDRLLEELLFAHFQTPLETRMQLSKIQLIRSVHDALISMTIYVIGNFIAAMAELLVLSLSFVVLVIWKPFIALSVLMLILVACVIIARLHVIKSRVMLDQHSKRNTQSINELEQLISLSDELRTKNLFFRRVEKYRKERRDLSLIIADRQSQFGFPRFILEATMIIGGMISGISVWYFLNVSQGLIVLASLMIIGLRVQPAILKIQNGIQVILQHKDGSIEALEMLRFYANKGMKINCEKLFIDQTSLNLVVEKLTYDFGQGINLFNKLDLKFEGFGVHILTGRNGIGKSTLFEILLGLRKPNSGNVWLNGENLIEHLPECLGQILAHMPQVPLMIQGSIEDNLLLNVDNELKRIEILSRAVEILKRLEFDEKKLNSSHASWNNILSEGEKAKIAIARTFAEDHCIVLLDEPTAALDKKSKSLVEDLIFEESKRRMIIVVTHDVSLLTLSQMHQDLGLQ